MVNIQTFRIPLKIHFQSNETGLKTNHEHVLESDGVGKFVTILLNSRL